MKRMLMDMIGSVLLAAGLLLLFCGFTVSNGWMAGSGAGLCSVAWNNVLPLGIEDDDD